MQDDYNHIQTQVSTLICCRMRCLYRRCCKSASVTSAVTCVQLRHRNQSSRLIRPGTCKPDSAHCRHLLRTCARGGDDLLVLSITPVCMEEAWQTTRPLTRISRRHRQVPAQSMSVISGTPARRTWPAQVHVCLQYSHEARNRKQQAEEAMGGQDGVGGNSGGESAHMWRYKYKDAKTEFMWLTCESKWTKSGREIANFDAWWYCCWAESYPYCFLLARRHSCAILLLLSILAFDLLCFFMHLYFAGCYYKLANRDLMQSTVIFTARAMLARSWES